MKAIWEEYGRSLVYVILATVLVLLTIALIGQKWREMDTRKFNTDYGSNAGEEALEEVVKREPPDITYRSDQEILTGMEGELTEAFLATDADGNLLTAGIVDIRNEQGETCAYPFTESGIYLITVRAEDDYKKHTQKVFRVPVNRGDI